MVRIDASYKQLKSLIGKDMSIEDIRQTLFDMGMELKGEEGDTLDVEITAERFDLMSTPGLARAIRAYALGQAPQQYALKKSTYQVIIDDSVKQIRPATSCTVISGLQLTQELLDMIIDVQEKLHATMCRNRKKGAIGIYPMEHINFPITYMAADPKNVHLTPLGESKKITAREMMQNNATAKQYAHLVREDCVPFFIDANKNILSVPPMLNSQEVGCVSPSSTDVFVEVSGFDTDFTNEILILLATMFAELGGEINQVTLSDGRVTPQFTPKEVTLDKSLFTKYIGLDLPTNKLASLAQQMMYDVKTMNDKVLTVGIPSYRFDIWHPIDVIDDLARAYGYNNLEPTVPQVYQTGGLLHASVIRDQMCNLLCGLGYNEVNTFVLSDTTKQLDAFGISDAQFIPVENGSETQNMMRINLMPELLSCFVENRNRRLPQKIFEVADVVIRDESKDVLSYNETRIGCMLTDNEVTYTELRQALDYIFRAKGKTVSVEASDYPFFMKGRGGTIYVDNKPIGMIGELSPEVLTTFGLIRPVVAFEIVLDALL